MGTERNSESHAIDESFGGHQEQLVGHSGQSSDDHFVGLDRSFQQVVTLASLGQNVERPRTSVVGSRTLRSTLAF